MEKGQFYLKEQLENDEFNRSIQDQYKRRFGVVTKNDEHMEEASVDSSSKRDTLSQPKKPPFQHYVSPFIELGKRFYLTLTIFYEPKLIHMSILLTTLWAFKSIKCINQLLVHKYGDLHYQITRPDSLRSRYKAFKVLALGGSVLPGCFIGFTLYDFYWGGTKSVLIPNNEGGSAARSGSPLIPYTLRRDISRKMRLLKEKTLFFAKDLAENNNLKRLSTEYHKGLDRRLHGLSGKKGPME
ncbi:conserved Plasmodium protein, unknown function [Plasmodium knowlesi strain H]|uniref:Uncharacterized protein n=3 Tax=Plasmodium knowlesi TaxID=5850 RepID=A0A5K1U0P6_PLAKH|nr:conserved protein, unknown function [Plasmodium knowlesi strain H]OTN66997.1 Uncharacterized protein PKNOH_S07457200 [Plasmodium knowlesi]CAA9988697.1 conserved protein, unknown function [Plasmodium knowlesi strain H]SBO21627.1 conserved Plasmodium protein, unknown function [Plasmodium knowlesi strain H]SBO21990.1 conserved Plasmodium protein, unknown function [Plasmodium knowlesi strain H]VVS78171.1 conserved protein, unknown function [Plasmodium knowlesi strain H]|eukprot:XP_002259674.1 hypothetical protein, conserved in Plasmodium species [Plasmodium knowlesi strain H]